MSEVALPRGGIRHSAVLRVLAFGLALGCSAPVCLALSTPVSGATWATNVHALGTTGLSVPVGVVEADADGSSGPPYLYRVNPCPTNGWNGWQWLGSNHFAGKTITFYDDGINGDTNYSPHATARAVDAAGNSVPGYVHLCGLAPGVTNLGSYEANWFVGSCIVSNLAADHSVLSFAFITTTSGQDQLTARVDRNVDTHREVFVQGVGPNYVGAAYGGVHPAGVSASYNIISVGRCDSAFTTSSISQYGPSCFGTAKPDLLSGWNQESEATGRGAGAAALLVDQANQAGWTNGSDPRVVKAIMLAGARKITGWDKGVSGTNDDHAVPLDYHAGAGILHCLQNYGIMYGGEMAVGSTNVRAAWDLGEVQTTARTNCYFVDAPQTDIFLSVTLAWNRHVGAGYTNLQNLDLRLYSVTGTTLYTELDWSTSQVDSVEHIYYLVGATGRYGIVVDGRNISTGEPYGIAFNLVGTSNSPLFDADADGLPDAFEIQHFREIYFHTATNDPDNDDADNYDEYVADTVPNSSSSVFTIGIARQSNDDIAVSFSSSTARQYRTDFNSEFPTNFSAWVSASNYFYGCGGLTNWIDDGTESGVHPSNAAFRAYRVRVKIP